MRHPKTEKQTDIRDAMITPPYQIETEMNRAFAKVSTILILGCLLYSLPSTLFRPQQKLAQIVTMPSGLGRPLTRGEPNRHLPLRWRRQYPIPESALCY